MLNFFDSVSCETIIAENEAYEQVLAMVRLRFSANAIIRTVHGDIAQLGERCVRNAEVAGSSPVSRS